MKRLFGARTTQLLEDVARVVNGAGLVASHSASLHRQQLIRAASAAYANNRPHGMPFGAAFKPSATAATSEQQPPASANASASPAAEQVIYAAPSNTQHAPPPAGT